MRDHGSVPSRSGEHVRAVGEIHPGRLDALPDELVHLRLGHAQVAADHEAHPLHQDRDAPEHLDVVDVVAVPGRLLRVGRHRPGI